MKLGDDTEHVTIWASQEEYEGGPGRDVLADIDVRIAGFAASVGTMIAASDWQAFVRELVALERTRRGAAVLRSAVDHELELRIYATGSAGQMAVAGHLARTDLPTRPRFVFEEVGFDPTLLPHLVGELCEILGSPTDITE